MPSRIIERFEGLFGLIRGGGLPGEKRLFRLISPVLGLPT